MPGFTHLHTASGFSLRYGASHPERLAERAAERGMDALALTDRDGLSGAVRFAKAAAAAGVRPLFGAELAVADGESAPRPAVRPRTPVRGGAFLDESAARVVFLARDGAAGWAALCRLVSAAHAGRTERPVLPRHALDAATDGLTVLLGPDSEVGRALAAARPDRAARLLAPGASGTATRCAWRSSTTGARAAAPAPCGWPPAPSASPSTRASPPS
ncbi:PHP domain-containing protein [Streptomyces noursei]|uniref:PHP domain-containing protein n=1 Tax=Streptomyces noursei TaxID=1971 RepID=UPI00045F010A|nr:DNA polymerase III alpha subunit [Streptomyces noursei]